MDLKEESTVASCVTNAQFTVTKPPLYEEKTLIRLNASVKRLFPYFSEIKGEWKILYNKQ